MQIQNRGTLGGNIANASPAGDTLPVLAAADATVVLRSADGERRVPFDEFYTGYRTTVLRPDELIVAIEIPPRRRKQWFRKVGTRRAQAISKIVMAGVRGRDAAHRVRQRRADRRARAQRPRRCFRGGSIADAEAALRRRSRRSTTCDRPRSTARVAANLLAEFWNRRHEGCKGAGVQGCKGCGEGCWVPALVPRCFCLRYLLLHRVIPPIAWLLPGAIGDGAGAAVSEQR